MHSRRIVIVGAVFIGLAVLAAPAIAHAADDSGFGLWDITKMAAVIAVVVLLGAQFFALVVNILAGWIQGVLALDPSGGGDIVFHAWIILRDMCNMAFIVGLIMISFGTIFNTLDASFLKFLKPYSLGRGVIVNFLVAAILLNFSLAIGQTVVAGSNQLSNMVIGLLPDNLGPFVLERLKVSELAAGDDFATQPSIQTGTAANTLGPLQFLSQTKDWTVAQRANLDLCLKGQFPSGAVGRIPPGSKFDTPQGCFETVRGMDPSALENTGFLQSGLNVVSNTSSYYYNRYLTIEALGSAVTGLVTKGVTAIVSRVFNAFMLASLALDFLVVLFFLLVRIPAIWILLALSPIAWTALAFPGMDAFEKWWKQFWAWNLFSPLFLFVLYLGLLLLQNVNLAVASLGTEGQSLFVASMGPLFLYLIAAIVFLGGTAMVLKASFLAGTYAGGAVTRITGFLGTGGEYGSFAPVARFLGTRTGATAAYQGALGGLKTRFDDRFTKPQARRQEEIEARYKSRFGDKGAYEDLQRKRIREQMKKDEESGLSVRDMRTNFDSLVAKGDTKSAKYFSLGQSLLKEGELNGAEMKALGENASVLGGVGQNALRQQIARKVAEQAKEKKFTGGQAADKALGAFQSFAQDDDKGREKFLRDLKKNQLSVYAQLADNAEVQGIMGAAGLDLVDDGTGTNTKRTMLAKEIIENNTSKLEADDIPNVLKLAEEKGWKNAAGGIDLGENFDYRIKALLNDKNNYSKMVDGADRAGKDEVKRYVDELKKEAADLEAQRAKVSAEAAVGAQERREAREQAQSEAIQEDINRAQRTAVAENIDRDQDAAIAENRRRGGGGGGGVPPAGAGPAPTPPRPPPGPTPTPPRPSPRPTPSPAPTPPPAGGGGGASRPRPSRSTSGSAPAAGARDKAIRVTVNGTYRGDIVVKSDAGEADMLRAAMGDPTIKRYLDGRGIASSSYLPLRGFNIVTATQTSTERNEQVDNLERARQQIVAQITAVTPRAQSGETGTKEQLNKLRADLADIERRLRTLRP